MAAPVVGIVMGSDSDLEVMEACVDALAEFEIGCEVRVLSAHRTPDEALEWARTAADRGLHVLVAGAGMAAHLPGVVAAVTSLPVIGVPIGASKLDGMDALLAIAQMPPGVPVATVAVDGARNAGLLAVRILAAANPDLRARVDAFRTTQAEKVRDKDARVRERFDHRRQGGVDFGFGGANRPG